MPAKTALLLYYNPKLVNEYAETVNKVFQLDVKQEHSDIFPKLLCKPCHMKLYQLKLKCDKGKNNDNENVGVIEHSDEFLNFVSHSSNNCYVCTTYTKRGRPGKAVNHSTDKSFDLLKEIKKETEALKH